ncbi:MAG: hypothetical protein ACT4OZ_04845 [Gemmatimonadota bacterium]
MTVQAAGTSTYRWTPEGLLDTVRSPGPGGPRRIKYDYNAFSDPTGEACIKTVTPIYLVTYSGGREVDRKLLFEIVNHTGDCIGGANS